MMIFYIDQMESFAFGFSFVLNYMVLGPLMAISNSFVYRLVKPESASIIINVNVTTVIIIMSIISYANGKI